MKKFMSKVVLAGLLTVMGTGIGLAEAISDCDDTVKPITISSAVTSKNQ